MSVTIIVDLIIKPDLTESYISRLSEAFAATRAFDGCEDIAAYRDKDNPNKLVVIERWVSREHYERYMDWRRSTGTFERLAEIYLEPMRVRALDKVA